MDRLKSENQESNSVNTTILIAALPWQQCNAQVYLLSSHLYCHYISRDLAYWIDLAIYSLSPLSMNP